MLDRSAGVQSQQQTFELDDGKRTSAKTLIGSPMCNRWLNAPADAIENIQARVSARNALEIVDGEEAAIYVGGYIK